MRKNVAIIYGGNSSEHDVSIQSGKNVAANVDREKYNVYEVLLKGASWTVQLHEQEGDTIIPVEID